MDTMKRAAVAALVLLAAGCASLPKSAHDGDLAAVNAYLGKGGSPNDRFADDEGCTLLHAAADGGQLEVAQVLLDRGADPNAIGPNGYTALHYAAGHQDVAVARLLLARGGRTSLEVRDQFGNTPLILAVATVRKEKGAWTMTSFGAVATDGARADEPSAELVALLVDSGADVRATTGKGNTPLHIAAYKGYANTVRLLLSRGAQRGARNLGGETAEALAARFGQAAVVAILRGE